MNELSKILFAQGNLRLCEDIYASYQDRIDTEIYNSPRSQIVTTLVIHNHSALFITIMEDWDFMKTITN